MDININIEGRQQHINISNKLFAKTKELAKDGKIDEGELNELLKIASAKDGKLNITKDEILFLSTLKDGTNVDKIKEGNSESHIELSLAEDPVNTDLENLSKLNGKSILKQISSREKELEIKDNKIWMSEMKGSLEKYSQVSTVSCITSSFLINTLFNHEDTLRVVKGLNRELNNLKTKSDQELKETFSNSALHSVKQIENWQEYTLLPILSKVMSSPPQALDDQEIKNLDEIFTHLNNYEKSRDVFLLSGKSSMLETIEGLEKKIGPDPDFKKQLKQVKSALNSNNLPLAAKLLSETVDVNTAGNSSATVMENISGKQYVLFSEGDILAKKYGFNLSRPTQQDVDSLSGSDKTKIAGVFKNMKDGEVLRLVEGSGKRGHSVNVRRIGDKFLYVDPMSRKRNLTPQSADELAATFNQPYKIDSRVQMNSNVNL